MDKTRSKLRSAAVAAGVFPSAQHRLLLRAALLSGDDALLAWREWVAGVDWEGVFDRASVRLLPLLHANLLRHGVDHPVMPKLKGIHRRAWYETTRTLHRMREEVEALRAHGIDVMLIKGAPLALAYYGNVGTRPMRDVDVVVPTADARTAIAVMERRGWRHSARSLDDVLAYHHALLLHDADGHECDLHWHVLYECCAPDADADFWRDAERFDFVGVSARTLNPADALLLVVVHGMRANEEPGIRWVADAVTIVREAGRRLDWQRLVEQAERRRLTERLGLGLEYLVREMDVSVPAQHLVRLAGARVSGMERWETSYALEPPVTRSKAALGGLIPLCATYRRHARDQARWRAVVNFPDYLRYAWQLRSRRELPGAIVRKVRSRAPLLVGRGERVATNGTGSATRRPATSHWWREWRRPAELVDPAAWRYLAGYLRGKGIVLGTLGLIAAAQSMSMVLVLALLRRATDVAIPAGDVATLLLLSVLILGLRIGDAAVSLWLRWRNVCIIKDAVSALRGDLITRLYALPRTVQTKADLDVLHARIVQDTARVDEMATALSTLVPAVFAGLALIGVLCILDWRLFLVAASVFPLLWLAAGRTGTFLESRVVVFQRAFEAFAKGTRFVLHHMDLTRLHGCEDLETARQRRVVDDLGNTSRRMSIGYAIHGQVQSVIVSLGGLLVFCGGGIAVGMGRLTPGEFLAFFVAAMFLNGQLTKVTGALPYVVTGNASLKTLTRLWMESRLVYGGRRTPSFRHSLRFVDVTYGYGEAPVLRDISLTIRPGSTIAIMGPNGAGKSTLFYLIAGLCRPWRGHLEADGAPYGELDLRALRRMGGFVLQNAQLFNASILDNLRYGAPSATREDAMHAARLASADEFIEGLPEGYETTVGHEGLSLSGGERQRLVIARALLGNPRLLVLDEPTNHLDTRTVATLMTNLLNLPQRPAILAISHDARVAAHMAEVYELREGRLEACQLVAAPAPDLAAHSQRAT